MDRSKLEEDLKQLAETYRQAREQVLRIEGAIQYIQGLLNAPSSEETKE